MNSFNRQGTNFGESNETGHIYTSDEFLETYCPTRESLLKLVDKRLIGPEFITKEVDGVEEEYMVFKPMAMSVNDVDNKACLNILALKPDGQKIGITVQNIRPFCIVKIPEKYLTTNDNDYSSCAYLTYLQDRAGRITLYGSYTEMYDYHGFQLKKKPCLRIEFSRSYDRKEFIRANADSIEIYEDDSNYVQQFLRHNNNISPAGWNALKVSSSNGPVRPYYRRVTEEIITTVADIITLTDIEYPYKDFMIVNAWDIETQKTGENMEIPKVTSKDVYIFAISAALNFWHTKDVIYGVVFSVLDVGEIKNPPQELVGKIPPIHVICKDERDLLTTYYKFFESVAPEVDHAFNGGRFDSPLMYNRIMHYHNLDEKIKIKQSNDPTISNPYENNISDVLEDAFFFKARRTSFENFQNMFQVRERFLKSEAGQQYIISHQIKCFGTVVVDSAFLCERSHPLMEIKTLNAFLSSAGLGHKEDMSYANMYRIVRKSESFENGYRENTYKNRSHAIGMTKVIYYSYTDSLKLSYLFTSEGFVQNMRAMANLGRYSIADIYTVANGTILMNMLAKAAYDRDRLFSCAYSRSDSETCNKFAGAYVVPPVYGLHTDRPVTGIDFSSLYPSLMATFNLSPDMLIDPDEVALYRALGYTVLELKIPYNVCERPKVKSAKAKILRQEICHACFIQHNGVINDDQKYTVLSYLKTSTWTYLNNVVYEMSYTDLSLTDKVYAMAKMAANKIGLELDDCEYSQKIKTIPGREKLPGEQLGVNAKLAQVLFALRKIVKAPYERICSLLEEMDAAKQNEGIWDTETGYANTATGKLMSRNELIFIRDALNATQNAIKVMANTIYGKSGEDGSYIFKLEVGAAIPYCGQHFATKPMIDLVKDLGVDVCYGDTDSLYVKCPEEIYAIIREKYCIQLMEKFGTIDEPTDRNLTQEETDCRVTYLWTPMVIETRKYINYVTEVIADKLCSMNNTRYLIMAYEEVGFPTYLGGKKKYALVPHVKGVNFYPKKLMIRGFDFKKRGQCPAAKRIGEDFLVKMLHPGFSGNNMLLLRDTFRGLLDQGTSKLEDFIVYKRYNPSKNNVQVINIVAAMTNRQKELQDAKEFERAELYSPPIAGETFPVIYVERIRAYDSSGKMERVLKAADIAEPEGVVRAYPDQYKINIEKYIDFMKSFLGRYIISEPIFDDLMPDQARHEDDDEFFKRCDKIRSEASKKYVLMVFAELTGNLKQKISTSAKMAKKISRVLESGAVPSNYMESLDISAHKERALKMFAERFVRFAETGINISDECVSSNYKKCDDIHKELMTFKERSAFRLQWIDEVVNTKSNNVDWDGYVKIASNNKAVIDKEINMVYLGAAYLSTDYRSIVDSFVAYMEALRAKAYFNVERCMHINVISKIITDRRPPTVFKLPVDQKKSDKNAFRSFCK